MHKANGDYPVSEVRYLYRLMLKGDRPEQDALLMIELNYRA
jgi:hypothetical protein